MGGAAAMCAAHARTVRPATVPLAGLGVLGRPTNFKQDVLVEVIPCPQNRHVPYGIVRACFGALGLLPSECSDPRAGMLGMARASFLAAPLQLPCCVS